MVALLYFLACAAGDPSAAIDDAAGEAPQSGDGAAGDGGGGDEGGGDDGAGDGGAGDDTSGGAGEVDDEAVPAAMDPVRLLFRASLDLRGVRPSISEIEAVEADPEAVEGLIEDFLYDARFPSRVEALYAEVFLTRLDSYYVQADDYGLDDEPAFAAAVGLEPLKMLGYIAENDLPYTELVTGDWTMAEENLGAAWPLTYPEGGEGWRRVQYTDGRPAAGMLATNSLWWRYMTSTNNANRGRANAISKMLLCSDFLARPVEFDRDVNLLDGDAVTEALRTNPGCVSCHYALEPLASYLWGFYYIDYDSHLDITEYHPERELMWEDYSGVAPGYFGEPGYTLADLGQQIASDARYPECAAEKAWSLLLSRDVVLEDTDPLREIRAEFLDNDMTVRSLFRAVTARPEYRAGPTEDARYAAWKIAGPDLLASQLEELTGFRFTSDGYDMMSTDTRGLRVLAGGIDGQFSAAPAREPTATMALVLQRLAEASADWALAHDDERPEAEQLFSEVGLTETPSTHPDAFVAQIQRLHLRLFGDRVEADGPEVAANIALWEALYEVERSPSAAWAGLLSALLRDPRFLYY